MRYPILTLLLVLSFSGIAQSEILFGDSLYNNFISGNKNWNSWYIKLENYHRLIEKQSFSKDLKDEFKISINEGYEDQLADFKSKMLETQELYTIEEEKNAYSLDTVKIEPLDDVKFVYFFRLYINYKWKKGEDTYILEFQACYINNQWHMMEPFQEFYE